MGKWIARVGLVLALGGSVHACRANGTNTDTAGPVGAARVGVTCGTGRQGCPCEPEGSVANCGTVVARHGDYVACSEGHSTCQAGMWGACIGTTLVTKSLASATIGSGGLHILSTTTQCPADASPQCEDLCDPNVYTVSAGGPGDVDATGIVAGEGGLTLAPTCQSFACQYGAPTDCPGGTTTTLVGTVRDPAGNNPVYNATVYVPTDLGALPPMQSGASCGACESAPPLDALTVAQTGPDGKFTLAHVPSTDVAPGKPIPLVVAVGKWRREVLLTSVPKCQTTAVDANSSRLPRNQFDGAGGHADLPKIAIASAVDPIECLLLKMGVDPAEFQSPGAGTRRIDYYTSGAPASLTGSQATLMNYDAVILPCEGYEDDGNDLYADNVAAYANAGGRLLTTHYGYTWLSTPTTRTANPVNPATSNPNPFYGVANWTLDSKPVFSTSTAVAPATLPGGQPFPKGLAFATWALDVGASSSLGAFSIQGLHADIASVNGSTTPWIQETSATTQPYFFSFDTPVGSGGASADGGAGACGRVDYSEFHVPATARVDSTAGGQCASDSDCGFTATCMQGTLGTCAPLRCTTNANCDIGYQCVGVTTGTCTPQTCTLSSDCLSQLCVGGTCGCSQESDCASGSCTSGQCLPSTQACTLDSECGSVERCTGATPGTCQKSCTMDSQCGQGELCTSGMCQGCYDGSTCPSHQCTGGIAPHCSASSSSFPLICKQGSLSPAEDALEFMLFDLTSCVSSDAVAPPPPTVSDGGTASAPGPMSDAGIVSDSGTVADAGSVEDGSAVFDYSGATFSEDFTSSCPQGTHAVWRELDWQASIPDGASIVFSAETATIPPDGGPPDYSGMTPITLATAVASSMPPGDVAYIDTGTLNLQVADAQAMMGAFNTANPPVISRDALRLIVTLNPTTDGSAAPTLLQWQVKADCLPAE